MNGKERMVAALSLQIPDRVPHWELAYNESSIIGIARHFTDDLPEVDYVQRMSFEDRLKLFEAVILVQEELDVDGVTLRIFPEAEFLDSETYKDDWGTVFRFDPSGEALVVGGPIRDEADLKSFRPPRIKDSDLAGLAYVANRFDGQRAAVLSVQCPFRRSWNLVGGMENLLLAYGDSPSLVHGLARMATDYTLEALELGMKLGADIFSLDGDLAYTGGMIMSPKHFREYLKPYYIELVDFVHRSGRKVFKHTDGDHWSIMEDFIEVGFDGIHPIQPQCLDIATVKKEIGGRICIMGNIDCMYTLVNGSEEDVEEEVRRTIEVAAPGGGYILASSNSIHPGVPPENYIAMVRAAHKYGRYDS